ncbi:MAG: pyridoxal-phosphate dependent enzyme [Planctomycetota bacterium]
MWSNEALREAPWEGAFPAIDFAAAAARIGDSIDRTPLLRLPGSAEGLDLRGKMENRQVTGSFKARGALNNVLQLSADERAEGVVASSSGNHGRALSWAARRAGVPATIVMPKDAYPNKIEACRAEGAEVVLAPDRWQADVVAAELAESGKTWIHPYDRDGTIEGAGTVGVEIAEDWPEVDVVVLCVGGGGLSAGSSLALRRALGARPVVLGAEPKGAAAMEAGLSAGKSVHLDAVTSAIQGLTTPFAGERNVRVCGAALDGVLTLTDEAIYAAQRTLVNDDAAAGWRAEVVEPAGAAAYAAVLDPRFESTVRAALARRTPVHDAGRPLRVAVTISGGNPAPAQLAALRA